MLIGWFRDGDVGLGLLMYPSVCNGRNGGFLASSTGFWQRRLVATKLCGRTLVDMVLLSSGLVVVVVVDAGVWWSLGGS